jgi:micrococcal nuclease
MKRFLLASLLCLPLQAHASSAQMTGTVVGVHDGDTVTVLVDRHQVKCRLANIDAPELRQPFGYRSKQALSDLVYRQVVHIEDEGGDRYGRRICLIRTDRGEANREMVREGMAWTYQHYNHDPQLPGEEIQARTEHRGLWADANPEAPWEWRKHPH